MSLLFDIYGLLSDSQFQSAVRLAVDFRVNLHLEDL